jgi:DNA-directed RNA polymerase specialized sigma24 family protein
MILIIKGRKTVMKDPEAAERFLEKTRGNIRSRIKKYQAREEESVQDLLVKWISSPADCWYKMLHSEGIPTMMEIKNPK